MVRVVFRYRDSMSNGEWRTQSGIYSSEAECIKWNGLGIDCDYEIVSVEEC